jgi:hypothetical protein
MQWLRLEQREARARSTLAETLLGIETNVNPNFWYLRPRSTLAETLLGIETNPSFFASASISGSTLAETLLGIETKSFCSWVDISIVLLWLKPF